jgi:NADPH:quinone reductase-like Zn-dependent oxidoreductase
VRAVVLREHGGLDALVSETVPDPVPGRGEALVRVQAVAVNRLDCLVRENRGHAYTARLPLIPGYDVAGEVVAAEPGANGVRVGQSVYVHYDYSCGRCSACFAGDESLCAAYGIMGVDHDGGYAELVLAPSANLFPLPTGLSAMTAAAGGSVSLTAYHMLFARGGLRAGETVLVMASGSGVGGAAMQLARWAGARVFATASTESKRRSALSSGAEAAFHYGVAGWSDELLAATDGHGADLVIDHTGADYFSEVLRSLAPRGRVVVCGATSGARAMVDLVDLFARQISIVGSSDGTRAELLTVLQLLADGTLAPAIDAVLPLAEAREAQRRLTAREHDGRILLDPGARPS